MKRLVVVGNGMAGMHCLEQILKYGPQFQVTVFGDETHVNYNRIMLSSVLAGEKAADDIVINPLEWYRTHGVALRLGVRIVDVDADAKTVTGDDGSFTLTDVPPGSYVILINAPGAPPAVATAAVVSGSVLVVTPVAGGTTTVVVTATDSDGQQTNASFQAFVAAHGIEGAFAPLSASSRSTSSRLFATSKILLGLQNALTRAFEVVDGVVLRSGLACGNKPVFGALAANHGFVVCQVLFGDIIPLSKLSEETSASGPVYGLCGAYPLSY